MWNLFKRIVKEAKKKVHLEKKKENERAWHLTVYSWLTIFHSVSIRFVFAQRAASSEMWWTFSIQHSRWSRCAKRQNYSCIQLTCEGDLSKLLWENMLFYLLRLSFENTVGWPQQSLHSWHDARVMIVHSLPWFRKEFTFPNKRARNGRRRRVVSANVAVPSVERSMTLQCTCCLTALDVAKRRQHWQDKD